MQMPGSRRSMYTKDDARCTLRYINVFGFTYFWGTLSVCFYASSFIYIPSLFRNDPETEDFRFHLACFILLQVIVNYFLCVFTNSYYVPSKSEAIPNSTWNHCLDCDNPKPPKTHHCPSCQRCVLKRDHHCFLTTTCIGFYNLRYMIVFCFYSSAAAGYTFYMGLQYVKLLYMTPFSWNTYHYFIFPITTLKYLMGEHTLQFVLHVALLYWSGVTMFCGVGFGSMQLIFALTNMTQRDIQQGRAPDISNMPPIFQAVRRIFGPWPWLNFIVPLVCFKPEGDGINVDADTASKLI